jgi:hypothetical protein
VGEIGRVVFDSAGTRMREAVVLDVDSSAASWIAKTEVGTILGSAKRRVLSGPVPDETPSTWAIRGLTLRAEYRDIRKPGIFSGAVVDRVITASFASEITDGGHVLFAGTTSATFTDTVDENSLPGLESESMGFTRSQVPDLRSLDRYIEPFVIIGATGAAIFLFFQVRS